MRNAVVWDRVFQDSGYEVYADALPPRGVLALEPRHRLESPNLVALHAVDAQAAGALCELIPAGFSVIHLTEEFPLSILRLRGVEFPPPSAWLFRLHRNEFVDQPDQRVRPLKVQWAGEVAKRWQPDWPAEPYVRRRITTAPSAAIVESGVPVAWALTHLLTDHVGIVGMVHVLEGHRRQGLARSVVSAVCRELMALGKIPTLHVYVDNDASLTLFPTLGFRKVTRQVWGDAVLK